MCSMSRSQGPGHDGGVNNRAIQSTCLKVDIDPGIKGLVALLLILLACWSKSGWNMMVLAVYLSMITVLLVDDYRFVIKNLVSYAVIFILPYLIGLLLSQLFQQFIPGGGAPGISLEVAGPKLLKLFAVWYAGSLYFFTTPFISIAEMLNQILGPLNRLGIPVTRYLHMVVWIVEQLTKTVDRFMSDVFASVRQIFSDDQMGMKPKLRELADVLAGFIAASLVQTEQIQSWASGPVLQPYRPRMTGKEAVAVLSTLVFVVLFYNPWVN